MKRLGIGMVGGRDSVRVSGHAQRSWYEHLWRVRTTTHNHAPGDASTTRDPEAV